MISPAGWVWRLLLGQDLPGPLWLASELGSGKAGALDAYAMALAVYWGEMVLVSQWALGWETLCHPTTTIVSTQSDF